MQFSALAIRPEILRATETMGYTDMTEIQQKAIPLMLEGHDMIAKAPTGTGKTVAFGIPILEKVAEAPAGAPRAVILSPTRELAQADCRRPAKPCAVSAGHPGSLRVRRRRHGKAAARPQSRLPDRVATRAGSWTITATMRSTFPMWRHRAGRSRRDAQHGLLQGCAHIIDLMKARKSLSMFSAPSAVRCSTSAGCTRKTQPRSACSRVEESSPKIAQFKLLTTGRDKLPTLRS